jgi:hypothetical protein
LRKTLWHSLSKKCSAPLYTFYRLIFGDFSLLPFKNISIHDFPFVILLRYSTPVTAANKIQCPKEREYLPENRTCTQSLPQRLPQSLLPTYFWPIRIVNSVQSKLKANMISDNERESEYSIRVGWYGPFYLAPEEHNQEVRYR